MLPPRPLQFHAREAQGQQKASSDQNLGESEVGSGGSGGDPWGSVGFVSVVLRFSSDLGMVFLDLFFKKQVFVWILMVFSGF